MLWIWNLLLSHLFSNEETPRLQNLWNSSKFPM